MSSDSQKPKIIIDEDWKSQVEAERQAAQRPAADAGASSSASPSGASPSGMDAPVASSDSTGSASSGASASASDSTDQQAEELLTKGKLPPASFGTLVEMLASQVLVFLGLYPDPTQKKPTVRLNFARHYIDTLAMLEEKTRGNLSDEEAKFLEHVLHDLRMSFVAVQKREQTG